MSLAILPVVTITNQNVFKKHDVPLGLKVKDGVIRGGVQSTAFMLTGLNIDVGVLTLLPAPSSGTEIVVLSFRASPKGTTNNAAQTHLLTPSTTPGTAPLRAVPVAAFNANAYAPIDERVIAVGDGNPLCMEKIGATAMDCLVEIEWCLAVA